jgi:hypothetical protein
MILSGFGLIISLILWALAAIIRSVGSGSKPAEPQKLLDDEAKSKHDRES